MTDAMNETQAKTPTLDELIDRALEVKRQREQEEREAAKRAEWERRLSAMDNLSTRLDPLFSDAAAEVMALRYSYDDDAARAYATVSDGIDLWKISHDWESDTYHVESNDQSDGWYDGPLLQQVLLERMGERREQRRVDAEIVGAMKSWTPPSA